MTDDEFNKVSALIHPAAPKTTEQQDREAAVRYYFEEYIGGYLYALSMAVPLLAKLEDQIRGDEALMKDYAYIQRVGASSEALMEVEDIVAHAVEKVGDRVRNGLATAHAGDCTAVPSGCYRCWAEGMYQLPYTANWTKHEGWALYNRFVGGRKDRNLTDKPYG